MVDEKLGAFTYLCRPPRDVAQVVEYTSGGRVVARSNRVIPTKDP